MNKIALFALRLRKRTVGLCLLPLVWVVGCQPSSPTVPVSGKVTYRGKPVADAWIGFVDPLPDGKGALAVTDAEGNFQMKTHVAGDKFLEGAMPGDYWVILGKPPGNTVKVEGRLPTPDTIAAMMAEGRKAKSRDERQQLARRVLPMKPPPLEETSLLPVKYLDPKESGLAVTIVRGERNDLLFDLSD